eukprot:Partr_v1_DN25682_c0_g1_i1_m4857 putative PPIases accelerate the folding of proteins. It catalyzes the cis-trans isomerization of proline imidic peptide bonds in oligopeptides. Acts as a regulatory subunit for PP2A-like phosphatases modulating their activity or substrate specificity, probably by inducing a conformational change in the catalytic subunit, a direct target of the PPIase. Can reactivate inactive phosphatase PP2A-phosphatase methylesterase complexes (PP2Ai) in presence of ATP and Mg(2 
MATAKRILTPADLDAFLAHRSSGRLLDFIDRLNSSVKSKSRSQVLAHPSSPCIQSLIQLLDRLIAAVDGFQVDPHSDSGAVDSRFGRPEFRFYFDHVSSIVVDAVSELVSLAGVSAVSAGDRRELCDYLMASFGDRQRIDYGTGHELHFLVFLYALAELDVVQTPRDDALLVVGVFWRYLEWMRKLQLTFWLEPAGSHGVWGLEDYHFLPFLFGSAQLIDHPRIRPKSIHSRDVVHEYQSEFMYLNCIHFVNGVKTESLQWHSPMLNDISGVKSWAKINQGMRKMFMGEVMGKLPIMQHMLFGRLFGGVETENGDTFVPPSGHSLVNSQKSVSVHVHGDGCHDHGDEMIEVVVKWVTSPSGQRIPIHGRVPKSSAGAAEGAIDTFAFGQAHPTCCGMRIPSAIGAQQVQKQQQQQRDHMLPFD